MNSSTQFKLLLLLESAADAEGTERSWRCCRREVVVVVNEGNIWGKYWLAMANRLKAGTKKLKLTERGLPSVLLSLGAWVMSRTGKHLKYIHSNEYNRVQINTLFSRINSTMDNSTTENTAFFLSRERERERLVDNNATFKLKVKGCYCHHNGGANQAETVQQSQARSDRKLQRSNKESLLTISPSSKHSYITCLFQQNDLKKIPSPNSSTLHQHWGFTF